MGGIGITAFGASLKGIVIFLLFVLFYVQLPGMLIGRLLGFAPRHVSTALVVGFYLGWALELAAYFAAEALRGLDLILYVTGPACSAVYIALLLMTRGRRQSLQLSPGSIPIFLSITFVLCFFYSLTSTQFGYMSPEISDFTYLYKDDAYHMGIINALAEGYPPSNPWFAGRPLYYHFFTEMLYAIPVRLFGLTSDFMVMSCAPYIIAYAFPLSAFALFRELCSRENLCGLYCFLTFAANMFLISSETKSWLYSHIFGNANSFCFSMSAAFVAVIVIKYWRECIADGQKRVRYFVILAVLTLLITGIKGPVGAVLIVSLWASTLLGLILRQEWFSTLVYVAILTACFAVVYLFVISGQDTVSSGGDLISPGKVIDYFVRGDDVMAYAQNLGIPAGLQKYVLAAVFMCFVAMAFTVPFVVGYIREVILVLAGRKPFLLERVTVYAFAAVGLLSMMILNFNGCSQIYFGFAGTCMIPIISFWFFEDFEGRKNVGAWIVLAVFVLCLIPSAWTMTQYLEKRVDRTISHATNYNNAYESKYKSITGAEYEALSWIRENTPHRCVLATNRYSSVPMSRYKYNVRGNNTFFLYAVYSGRSFYLEGAGYSIGEDELDLRLERIENNDKLYDAAYTGRGKLAHDLGIQYVVVSKDFGDFGDLENDNYRKCFSNEAVDIYEITY